MPFWTGWELYLSAGKLEIWARSKINYSRSASDERSCRMLSLTGQTLYACVSPSLGLLLFGLLQGSTPVQLRSSCLIGLPLHLCLSLWAFMQYSSPLGSHGRKKNNKSVVNFVLSVQKSVCSASQTHFCTLTLETARQIYKTVLSDKSCRKKSVKYTH